MAEYIEREALMKYPIRIDHYDKEHGSLDFVLGIESVLEYAENLPAADVVEVCRCRDCKHLKDGYKCYCPLGSVFDDNNEYMLVDETDFCSYGERRSE